MKRSIALLVVLAIAAAACGSGGSGEAASEDSAPAEDAVSAEDAAPMEDAVSAEDAAPAEELSRFVIEVWADNWSAVYVDGVLIGEDSVSITTERSFNAETYTFEAVYPFTVAIEAKDFKETDSGIEYIGQDKQQMGDGGIIAQVTDAASGEVVAWTNGAWAALVVHQAPLNKDCEKDSDPDATCEFLIIETPSDWTAVDFDDSGWSKAAEWSEGDVGPKDGYDEISWDSAAHLIWGNDLESDNTVLLRTTVTG